MELPWRSWASVRFWEGTGCTLLAQPSPWEVGTNSRGSELDGKAGDSVGEEE